MVVYDYYKDGDSNHRRPPSCLLAHFEADLIVNPNHTIKLFPYEDTYFESKNHTCGFDEQSLEFYWRSYPEDLDQGIVYGTMLLRFSRNTTVSRIYLIII